MSEDERNPGEGTDEEVENDPRGGLQSEEYREAGPSELVEEGDTAMMGPGGSPPRADDDESS